VLGAEVKILTGRIVPHYLAGFTGGRAALIPGVAGLETILANQRLTLAPGGGLDERARPCSLEGNPVHLDMLEGARMAGPDFCLDTLLDAEHRIVSAVAGDFEAAHAEGCRRAGRMFRATAPEPVDVLVTSAGGSPYDATFMQALKAVFDVRDVVRPDGAILWIAECGRGLHPGFLRWCSIADDGEMERAVRERFDLRGHVSLMLRRLTRDVDVALWSSLPADTVRALGLHPVRSLDAGLDWIRRRFGPGFTYAVAPFANVVCGAVEG
jgi:nickel-dependent lactate racemase